ncbi:MAG: UbiA family prenyltransferase, partial [Thermoplasmatales archaeon]
MNDSQPKVTDDADILSILSSISKMSAWKALFFTDMHACFFIILYVLFVKNMFSYNTLINVLFLFVSLGLYIVYMYLINDYFDMSSDKKAGEHREIHDLPQNLVILIILILIALSFTITIKYINRRDYTLIYLISYFLATFYSAPPLRLKSRGIYGIISNILIEK